MQAKPDEPFKEAARARHRVGLRHDEGLRRQIGEPQPFDEASR